MNWKKEYKECLLNNKYMLEKYILKNDLWQAQKDLLNIILENKLTIVTKSRDVGFTSLVSALSAREIALNSEKKVSILYISQNAMMNDEFKNKLKNHLKNIPEELFTGVEPYHIQTCNIDNYQNRIIGEEFFDVIIIDEPVVLNDNIDVIKLVDFLKYKGNKIIIGGVGNHKNKTWFDFISMNKHNTPYMIMPWFTNPNHKGLKKTYYYNNNDNYEEEYECKVFKKIYI